MPAQFIRSFSEHERDRVRRVPRGAGLSALNAAITKVVFQPTSMPEQIREMVTFCMCRSSRPTYRLRGDHGLTSSPGAWHVRQIELHREMGNTRREAVAAWPYLFRCHVAWLVGRNWQGMVEHGGLPAWKADGGPIVSALQSSGSSLWWTATRRLAGCSASSLRARRLTGGSCPNASGSTSDEGRVGDETKRAALPQLQSYGHGVGQDASGLEGSASSNWVFAVAAPGTIAVVS